MNMQKGVSIIIVHWNTPQLLYKLVKNLYRKQGIQLIIIDNASEKSIGKIKKIFPKITYIQNKYNRGYAFACNQGTQVAKREWLLFLNPDNDVTSQEIQLLKSYAIKEKLVACSPLTKSSNYQKPLPSVLSLLAEFTPLKYIVPLSVFRRKTLFGGCLLIKKSVLLKLGGWDERFFIWFEDSDLTKRLLMKNYNIGYMPFEIKHGGGASFKKLTIQAKRDVFFNSMDVFARKHFNYLGVKIITLLKKKYSDKNLLPLMNNTVSVSVPNLIYRNLENFLQKNRQFIDTIGELIVVSSDISTHNLWKLRNKYKNIRFVTIDKNRGFAPTVNIGLRASTGEWIGTINDDTIVSDKHWIKKALSCTNKTVGSVNPVIYSKNHTIESAGIDILKIGKASPIKIIKTRQSRMRVDATNAAAVLYQKKALTKVGLFDERFKSYLEDIDLSLRLKNKGYSNVVCPHAHITHIGQLSSSRLGYKKQIMDFKNWILVVVKNWKIKDLVLLFPQILIERLRNISGILKAYTITTSHN